MKVLDYETFMANQAVVEALKKTGRVARDGGLGVLAGGISGAMWGVPFAAVDAVQNDDVGAGYLNTVGSVAVGAGTGAAIGSTIDQFRGKGRTSLRPYGTGIGSLTGIVGSAISAFKSGNPTEADAQIIKEVAEDEGVSPLALLAMGGVAGLGIAAGEAYVDGSFDKVQSAAHGSYDEPAVAIVDIVPVKEAKARAQSRKRSART